MLGQRILFYLINIGAFFLFHLHKIMWLRPQSVHQWRQCDSASYCLNFFQNPDSNFFFPQVMSQWAYKGYVISEFPIIYWLSGKISRLIGYSEATPRILTYLLFIVGLIFIFELGLKFLKNKWLAFFPILIIYSSPLIIYYALNYLPNIPGLSLTFISWYFFFAFLTSRRFKDFYLCSFFALIAALLKPVEIFNYFIFFGILFLEYYNLFGLKKVEYANNQLKSLLITFLLVLIISYSWIYYASGFAKAFGYGGNLLGILPIWEMSSEEIRKTIGACLNKWAVQILWPIGYSLLIVLTGLFFLFYKKVNRYLFLSILFSFIGQIIYILLFFQVFYDHDYYMINVYIIPVLLSIGIMQIWESLSVQKTIKLSMIIAGVFFFFFSIKHSVNIIYDRYYGNLREGINPNLQTITPYLRSIGISKEDLVVSVPDYSPNVSLYLMGQKGWSSSGLKWTQNNLDEFKKDGAKFFILSGPITQNAAWFLSLSDNEIGNYKGIKIYKLE